VTRKKQIQPIKELTETDDLRNFSVSRLMLNNIQHLKAYWVMIGPKTAQKKFRFWSG